jgi:hypothetical protein
MDFDIQIIAGRAYFFRGHLQFPGQFSGRGAGKPAVLCGLQHGLADLVCCHRKPPPENISRLQIYSFAGKPEYPFLKDPYRNNLDFLNMP